MASNKGVLDQDSIQIFCSPKEYQTQLFSLIKQAKHRIYLTALYLQDDDAGRSILSALYQAKQLNPKLDIKVFVDAHRAQRGLIGEKNQLGNRACYLEFAKDIAETIDIYGVPVKRKELFGVLHLKGMVFDDVLLYSGASINNVYLHWQGNYRLDRYYQINSRQLSDCFCQYLDEVFVQSKLAYLLNTPSLPSKGQQKRLTQRLKSRLKKTHYRIQTPARLCSGANVISVEPLVGCGRRGNRLNAGIRQLLKGAEHSLLIFTPYFNLPKVLTRDVIRALKRGVKVTLVVGDKKANDFFIGEDKEFSTIGIIPYVYEILLVRFIKRWQSFVDSGQLKVHLWQDGSNSFHLKGLIADERYHLLTGSNLNPRAWGLDLENGLLIDDAGKTLMPKVRPELDEIMRHCTEILSASQLDTIQDYPEKPKRLLKRLHMSQIDRLLKRFL